MFVELELDMRGYNWRRDTLILTLIGRTPTLTIGNTGATCLDIGQLKTMIYAKLRITSEQMRLSFIVTYQSDSSRGLYVLLVSALWERWLT
jgi:hypothetical protein